MKIAQIAPLYESVPPKTYGGTERVVSYLTEELVRQGHDVTLFASGDSVTSARLVSTSDRALRLDEECSDPFARHVVFLEEVFRHVEEFDVAHFHLAFAHFPTARREDMHLITTQHGRLDLPDLVPLFQEFQSMPLVSVSDAQREPLPWANWMRTIYHGLPPEQYTLHRGPGSYLAFLGRVSSEKRVDRAIEIAKRLNLPLKIAAKVDVADRSYFEKYLQHMLDHPLVEFVGEIAECEKNEFLGDASALLFPIDWPEPFGLVMIEAMACGTPVIAFRGGSVPEIIEQGENGFIVESIEDAVEAVRQIPKIERVKCREIFERRFNVARMAEEYVQEYERLLSAQPARRAQAKVSWKSR